MLEAVEISKSFGEVNAVERVSFTAQPGEIFGLLGPNGAGKSTTIRMIMNILAPDAGTILFDGRPINEKDKDRIGYLPEERGLYRKVKVQDMLLYLAGLKGVGRGDALQRMSRWLEIFELGEWKGRKVDELSKGMSQKVQLIAALLHEPEFIFLDEPFAGLDPVSADMLREAILDLGRKGRTILFSTHNMEQAERICRRLFLMDHGLEVLAGTLEEIKSRFKKNSVIVEFDGDIDFLDDSDLVRRLIRYPRWVEVELEPGADSDELLKMLAHKISVKRYEVVAPTLHQIFIQHVGRKGEENE